jgi:hypothetical protein
MPPFEAETPGINGWRGLDLGQRLAAFLRVRNGRGFPERFVAGPDRLGEAVLIEFRRLRLPPAGGDVVGGDGDRLEARFHEGERRGARAQGLELDLLQGVREEPALELDAGLGRAFAGLEFVQGGFGALGERFVIDDGGVESRDEFEEVGLAFEEVGEEIGIVGGQDAELVEERLLRLQLLAERKRGSRFMNASRRRGPDATRRTWRSPWSGSVRDVGNSKWGAGNLQTSVPSGPFANARACCVRPQGPLAIPWRSDSGRSRRCESRQKRTFIYPSAKNCPRPFAEVRPETAARDAPSIPFFPNRPRGRHFDPHSSDDALICCAVGTIQLL